jgi:Ca2+-transporting ATPase
MLLAFVVGFGLQIAVTEITFITKIFGTVALSVEEWLILTALSTAPLWFHEIFVFIRYMSKRQNH